VRPQEFTLSTQIVWVQVVLLEGLVVMVGSLVDVVVGHGGVVNVGGGESGQLA
jgi:hypothetical protein